MGAGWGAQGNSFYIGWDLLLRLPQDIICSVRGGLGVHMHPKSWHCQNWVEIEWKCKKNVVKWSILGNKGTLLGGNHHLLAIADHFGGHSVHCGQIVQKNPCKGQTPLYGSARILGTFGPPSPPLPRLYRWGPGDPGKAKHAETVPKIILQPQVMNCIVLPTLVSVQVL